MILCYNEVMNKENFTENGATIINIYKACHNEYITPLCADSLFKRAEEILPGIGIADYIRNNADEEVFLDFLIKLPTSRKLLTLEGMKRLRKVKCDQINDLLYYGQEAYVHGGLCFEYNKPPFHESEYPFDITEYAIKQWVYAGSLDDVRGIGVSDPKKGSAFFDIYASYYLQAIIKMQVEDTLRQLGSSLSFSPMAKDGTCDDAGYGFYACVSLPKEAEESNRLIIKIAKVLNLLDVQCITINKLRMDSHAKKNS